MKIFLFLILIVAFLMFYQKNALYAVIIMMILLGLYLFFKRKKHLGNGSGSGFFSGGNHNQNDLIDLIFVQQLINSSVNNDLSNFNDKFSSSSNEKEIKIERIKKEIMELLDK